MKRVIHWFRRDLRLCDNSALYAALRAAPEVVPVYILSQWRGSHPWTGAARQQFLCGCVEALAGNIAKLGGRLIIRQGAADAELARLITETGTEAIFFNRDPDPFGRQMEKKVAAVARSLGASVHDYKDVAIHERDEVLTGKGGPYRVFTPYARAWRDLPKPPVRAAPRRIATPRGIFSLALPTPGTWGFRGGTQIIAAGEEAARRRLARFMRAPIGAYGGLRDFPAAAATSRLSQDLRFGLLSPREVHVRALAARDGAAPDVGRSIDAFVNELIWREFYLQVLWHWPHVLESGFDPERRGARWYEPGADFDAWRRGETGFPLVDAAMRQLNTTGFMHNRLRMVTAMFLTKDLHVHWKAGESYFMQRLVDGDIASNNGGWQWSAGTGADAAPYFRIQNPWTQSARFDPKGEFIKEWIPELRDIPPALLATPPGAGWRLCGNYPAPVVDHAKERKAALLMLRQR